MLSKSVLLAAALAAIPASAELGKPALTPDLDYLLDGNTANLPQNGGPYWGKWEDGLMPEDCKSIAEGQDLNPADFEVYDVFYDDVRPMKRVFIAVHLMSYSAKMHGASAVTRTPPKTWKPFSTPSAACP